MSVTSFPAQAIPGKPRPPERRGACPSLTRPMQTGDGLLARLRFAADGLSPDQWTTIANLSRSFGNGLLEITSRGSLQLRGLDPQTAPRLAGALDAAGISTRAGVVVETPPLSGLDTTEIADARGLAERIRLAVDEYDPPLTLAPKLSIVVNGGGRLNLSTMAADLRLDAVRNGAEVLWRAAISGDVSSAIPLGLRDEVGAVETILSLLEKLSATGPATRGRDIVDAATATGEAGLSESAFAAPASPVGVIDIGNGTAIGIRLPFGRTHADDLETLMTGLAKLGATEIRLAQDHCLLIPGLPAEAATLAIDLAMKSGFLTDPADPANSVFACPGAGFCDAAQLDTREVAKAVIASAPSLLDGSCPIHVSGCSKGCAHPSPAAMSIIGTDQGAGVVIGGKANDPAERPIDPETIAASFARLEAFLQRRRHPGETTRSVFDRLGTSAIAAVFKA